ncbi:hypothetical protein M3Y99_00366100 [Aphelenchoides fujianensis]|nr:hypothetical protein M3Y99_00366100 [Aphelenchoides fujianensis]
MPARPRQFELLSLPGWNRAEALRMMFRIGGRDFFDYRMSVSEWREFKHKSSLPPEVRLPLLRIGGLTIAGGLEIGRLLAREFGLYAESTIEEAQIEEIVGYVEVLHRGLLPIIRDTLARNEKQRMRDWEEFKIDLLLPILDVLVRRLADRPFFVSDRLTWADVAVAEILSRFDALFDRDFLLGFPALDAHRKRVETMPGLQQTERPRSLF